MYTAKLGKVCSEDDKGLQVTLGTQQPTRGKGSLKWPHMRQRLMAQQAAHMPTAGVPTHHVSVSEEHNVKVGEHVQRVDGSQGVVQTAPQRTYTLVAWALVVWAAGRIQKEQ